MTEMSEALDEWISEMRKFKLPRWAVLPDLDLYLDQVITLVENYLSPLMVGDEKFITTSMVHNYVKHKVMPASSKKKYTKRHVAYLIAISTLKQVVTLPEISDGIMYQGTVMDTHEAYDLLCEAIENSLGEALDRLSTQPNETKVDTSNVPLSKMALHMAVNAFVSRCMTKKLLLLEKEYVLGNKGVTE